MSPAEKKAAPAKKGAASSAQGVPEGLSSEDIQALAGTLRDFLESPRHERALSFFTALSVSPPQVLLLEGGDVGERRLAALYWALLLNCPNESDAKAPCLECPVCKRILGQTHRDIFVLDGSGGSIKIEEVRELRSVLGEPPREANKRVIILAEAQSLTEAAANAMLKSLEEPRPGTVFVLLAPQRERLLPTLVSRSWVLTLAWPDSHAPGATDAAKSDWESALASFVQTGTGLFEKTTARGSMDAAAAQTALLTCQRALAKALSDEGSGSRSALVRFFASLPDDRRRMADEVMAEAQDSLGYMTNPALVVEWMATRFYLLAGRR